MAIDRRQLTIDVCRLCGATLVLTVELRDRQHGYCLACLALLEHCGCVPS